MKKYIYLMGVLLLGCRPYADIKDLSTMDELKYPYEVSYFNSSSGIKLAYADEGSGDQTILFVHGLGSYLPAWKKNIEELRQSYRCIAVDLPGYGKSSKGNHSYDMKFFANVLAEFIRENSLQDELTFVGHSMGGQIGTTLALYHPDILERLVLVSPAGFETFHEGQKQWFRDIFTARLVQLTPPEAIQSNLAYNFYNMPEDATFMITDRIAMRQAADFENYCYAVMKSVNGMVDQPVYDFLPDIQVPVLVFFGENDNLIPNRFLNPGKTVEVANKGMKQLQDGKLVMLPKTGHFAQFESYETINEEIKAFIQQK